MDFTLALGNPDSDSTGTVSLAWVHLRRVVAKKYSLTTITGSPEELVAAAEADNEHFDGKTTE